MPVKYQDYYEILGVPRNATQEQILSTYRKLARQYHPDVNKSKDAEERFKRINEAYAVLRDPQTRRRYDMLGSNWRMGQDFSPPPGWENIRIDFGPGGFDHRDFDLGGGFSDFFKTLFGGLGGFRGEGRAEGGGGGGWATAGQDHEADITVTLDEVYHGAKKTVSLQVSEPDARRRARRVARTYEVTIPPGITDRGRIRLAGQGTKDTSGGQPGDLYLRVHIAPHPVFRVREHNLELDLPVTPWEAALGTKIEVPTLDGPVTMTLPPAAQSGQRMRLRGKGMPKRGGARGDLYAVIQIAVPKQLSQRERELFEELARASSFTPRRSHS